ILSGSAEEQVVFYHFIKQNIIIHVMKLSFVLIHFIMDYFYVKCYIIWKFYYTAEYKTLGSGIKSYI
ncbi:MAG: hypothetical protein IJV31_04530, partial [Clostridia bacterium]|nr:hypothetical protein [Clostridia bacterium]